MGQNCSVFVDPSGYFEFVNTESKFTGSGYAYGPNPAYANTNELIGRYIEAQNALIADIQNVFNDWDQGNLANCNTDQNRKVLQGVQSLLQSNKTANVSAKATSGHQGRTLLGHVSLYNAGSGHGWSEKEVLFHESIHVLQHRGLLPFEIGILERKYPSGSEYDEYDAGTRSPGPTAYEYQAWFFRSLKIQNTLPLRHSK